MPAGPPRLLILYDGVCGLCDRAVQFVLPRDREARFAFSPLQSRYAQDVLARHGRERDFDTFVLVEDPGGPAERVSDRFRGALRVLWGLGGVWALLAGLAWWIPDAVGNVAYRWVARNRYAWFGKADACLLPSPRDRERFVGLDDLAEGLGDPGTPPPEGARLPRQAP